MRKTINIILIMLHLILVTPVGEVFAYEYRLTTSTLSPGKKVDSTNFTLKQSTIGEPFGGKTSNANYKVKFGYIPSTATTPSPPRLMSNIPDNFLSASNDMDDYFENPFGGPLTYTVIGNSSIDIFIDDVTHVVSWEPLSLDFVGSEEVFFIAENSEGLQAESNSVILTVSAPPGENNPPILRHIPDITANEGETITINAPEYGYDFDGDPLTYTYSGPFNAEGVWETDYDDRGTYIVKVTVLDGKGGIDSQNVKITVNNVNAAPVLSTIGGKTVNENSLLQFTISASDSDGDVLTYSASNLPEGATFNPDTRVFSWTPSSDQAGVYTGVHFEVAESVVSFDENIKLLLHCEGSDGSTSFSDSSYQNHTMTANGTAQVDTAYKKLGTGSMLLDGNSDYVDTPDSADWDVCGSTTDDWTIDLWVKHAVAEPGSMEPYISHWEDENNYWDFERDEHERLQFILRSGGSAVIAVGSAINTLIDTNWHHVALCKVGSSYGIYLDGNQVAYASDTSIDTYTGNLQVGYTVTPDAVSHYMSGHMDEMRISHFNEFGAAPNASSTDTITVPTKEHDASLPSTNRDLEDITITVNDVNVAPAVSISLNPNSITGGGDFTIHIDADDGDGDVMDYVLKENGVVIDTGTITDTLDIPRSAGSGDGYSYSITVTDPLGAMASDVAYLEIVDTSAGQDDIFPVSGDFNGDGLTDVGTWDKRDNTWRVSYSEGGNFNSVGTWSDIFGNYSYSKLRTYSITGDFNGDGRVDIAMYDTGGDKAGGGVSDGGTWKFAFSGSSFDYNSSWDVTKFGGGICNPLIGDFNGDGVTDIGYSVADSNEGSFFIKLAKDDRTGFEEDVIPYKTDVDNSSTYSGDFNGDGLADILAFNRSSGGWHVLLAQDATSAQLVDWVQEPGTTGSTVIDGPTQSIYGSHESTCDGNFNTPYAAVFAASNGSAGIKITTEFQFSEAVNITKVVGKCYTSGSGGYGSEYRRLYLYYGDDWQLIADTDNIANSELGSGTTISGNWNGVTKAKLESYRYQASLYTFTVWAKNYELEVLGPPDVAVAANNLPTFSNEALWIDNFGNNREPVIADYNHDGMTDIGYFDSGSGEWRVALSDGTKFNQVVGTHWPTPFGQASNILPSGGDYNGDGIGDAAVFHKDRHGVLNKWEIKLHSSNKPDLLVAVDNGVSGTTNIEYDISTQFDNTGGDGTPDLPFPVSVVKKVTKSDGMGNSYEINYEYQDGMFEPGEREFRGFKFVKVIDSEGTVKETRFHQDDIYKGRPEEESVSDASGTIYSRVQYEWASTLLHGGIVTFPHLASKTSTLFNVADGTSRDVKVINSNYDNYGNVGRIEEEGFVDDANDNRVTLIEYEYNLERYIAGKPKHTTIQEGGSTISETWYTYDVLGSLKQEEKCLSSGASPITKFTYDYEISGAHCGNIVEVEDALGRKTTTEYRTLYEYTFPTKVTNAVGHTQEFVYDYKTGQITESFDPNGQLTQTTYDGFGRILKIIGPYDSESSPGIKYSYDMASRPMRITTITKLNDTQTSTSYAFLDSLGRTIEVKTEAEDESGVQCQIVSGIVKHDSRGQVIEKYLPYFVSTSPDYVAPTYGQPKIQYVYDAVGRAIQTIAPDNVVSYVEHRGWIVTVTDGNGHKKNSENDAYGRLIEIIEYSGGEEYVTEYRYDGLGNLKTTIDSQGNVTSITYDSLGRKIAMDDPDMGHWEYEYDAVGNLISQTDSIGNTINFVYDAINRLTEKSGLSPQGTVPDFSVIYTYDQGANGIGRLSQVTDSSGTTEFFYDKLGREIKTIKGLSPQGTIPPTEFYTIERTYDSLDRLVAVTYPDGEVVTYAYNRAGGIKTITGNQNYVTGVYYNAHGQMTKVVYGNGTSTDYTYDVDNLRLQNLKTVGGSSTIQDLSYTFDAIGNVLSITDNSDNGTNSQAFQYDDLDRLISATGAGYQTINYAYDSIGNMLQKGDLAMTYGEAGAGPHALTSSLHVTSGDTISVAYDANGNMLSKESDVLKNFKYDIENRLTEAATPKEAYLSNYAIELQVGWNFVSIPVIVTDNIETILQNSGITQAQISQYDAATQEWQHFIYKEGEDLSKFCDFFEFDYGRGYEIYVGANCTLTVSGATPLSEKTLELSPGHNLITTPTTTSVSVEDALEGVTYDSIVAASSLRGIADPEAISYVDVDTLEAGYSYFVNVSQQQTWNIPREKDKTTHIYDGDGGRVKKITENEIVTYIGSSYESRITSDETQTKKHIFMGSARICTVEDNGTTPSYHYFHQDHIGSSNVVTDETGQLAKLIEYTPYGLTNRDEGSYNTDCKFTGQLFDTSSELYYYGARYYDPELGRFIQPDTIVPYPSDPQSFNRYAYARNNPIRYIDPSGHSFILTALAMIATFAACVSMYASVGAIISGGKTEQVFNAVAQIAGIVALVTGGISTIGNAMAAAKPTEMLASNALANADVMSDARNVVQLEMIVITRNKAIETAVYLARASIITSGVAGGNIVLASVMSSVTSTTFEGGKTLVAANVPHLYKHFYPQQYRTQLNPGEIGIGFKWSGWFYHSGLEARNVSGQSAIIDFNRNPNTNIIKTGLGKDVPGGFGNKESYDFYMVVDNNPAKVQAFFELSEKINSTKYWYNAYGRGTPFNCYEGQDWILDQLKIENPFRWPY